MDEMPAIEKLIWKKKNSRLEKRFKMYSIPIKNLYYNLFCHSLRITATERRKKMKTSDIQRLGSTQSEELLVMDN